MYSLSRAVTVVITPEERRLFECGDYLSAASDQANTVSFEEKLSAVGMDFRKCFEGTQMFKIFCRFIC